MRLVSFPSETALARVPVNNADSSSGRAQRERMFAMETTPTTLDCLGAATHLVAGGPLLGTLEGGNRAIGPECCGTPDSYLGDKPSMTLVIIGRRGLGG